jgi:hypothetical protein
MTLLVGSRRAQRRREYLCKRSQLFADAAARADRTPRVAPKLALRDRATPKAAPASAISGVSGHGGYLGQPHVKKIAPEPTGSVFSGRLVLKIAKSLFDGFHG